MITFVHATYVLAIFVYQQYLSFHCPDFYEIFKVGSWEHLEQIPNVMMTFVHISNIQEIRCIMAGALMMSLWLHHVEHS